jgi:hypothetical protein
MCGKAIRSSSAQNRTARVEKYISPFLKRGPAKTRKQPKSTRNSAQSQPRKISASLNQQNGSKMAQGAAAAALEQTLKHNKGPLSQLASNLLMNAGHSESAPRRCERQGTSKGKEGVGAVSLHRKINKLDAVVNK